MSDDGEINKARRVRARRRWVFRFALVFLSLFFTAVVAEILIRVIDPSRISVQNSWHTILYEAYRESANPDLVWEHIPGYRRRLPAYSVAINQGGLREAREVAREKPAGAVRVLCLGDSFTFGAGVEVGQTWVEKLESTRPLAGRVESINAGINGYNTLQELAWLRAHGIGYSPDFVIVFWVENDVTTLTGPASGLSSREQTDRLLRIHPKSWKRRVLHAAYRIAPGLTGLTRLAVRGRGHAETPPAGESDDLLMQNPQDKAARDANLQALADVKAECEAHKIGLVVASCVKRKLIEEACSGLAIDYVAIFEKPEDYSPATYWMAAWDPHPNVAGHEVIARKLAAHLAPKLEAPRSAP